MIELLVGAIASGKSTYSRRRAQQGALVINDDSIVNAVHADNYQCYENDLKPLYKTIEMSILSAGVISRRDVVIDGVNMSKASRARWTSLARSFDTPVKCIVFPFSTPEVHAKRRADADARGLTEETWLSVAKKHISQYEEPDTDEGFFAIERAGF